MTGEPQPIQTACEDVVKALLGAIAEFRGGIEQLQVVLHGDHETISNKYLAERINRLEDKLERAAVAGTDNFAEITQLKLDMRAINDRLDKAATAIKPLLALSGDLSELETRLAALEKPK